MKGSELTEVARALFDLLDEPLSRPEFISFPTILVKKPRQSHRWSQPGSHTAADSMIAWFRANGLAADRTRLNFSGYPGLLRDLGSPPPWIEVKIEDVTSEPSPARSKQLRHLYIQKEDHGAEEMIRQFRTHRAAARRFRKALDPDNYETTPFATQSSEAAFRELLSLGSSIGPDEFDSVYSAVFEYPEDDFLAAPGAPDLLVWHPAGVPGAWFFSEVKAPGDKLQESQKDWLNQNRHLLSGHFLLTYLE